MDLSSLEIFRAVAHEASVTRAAQRLQRAQSNVTTRIRQLEEDLGVELFLRDGKRMSLTERGSEFLAYAEQLLALADEARQSMHPAEPGGRLRLGSMESTAANRLPALLASYHKACPRVALEVSTGTSRALFDGVRARRLDCALVAAGPGWAGELDGSGLRGEPLFREDLLMILPAEHPPVHDVAEVRLRTLAGFARGCTYRQLAEDSLGTPLTVQEVGSYHAILACVAAGACVGVLPRSVLQLLGTPPLRSLPLAEVDTWLVWREGYATAAFERWRGVLGQAGD
ncbi:LysR family transcriptional regulator NmoR [Pseudomonas aeruginosa]|jgi:DNA-binding transcriptional LysR family regulator|uniref:LysR family transcriptional regulator n=1 Tax=Pseudomonas aeruginosa TaxID=287 RepID=A0A643ERH1_PSEAI|nr:LysR family transcriptional regulator NmoR [Pseudomonas aeruginosa]HCL2752613.1 LysR family transcriptional regulator [Pseudomonas aeruginosa 449A]AKO84915.1 LysR family transcriptional regulator [Pseudomonas aeruginosa DSM 50071 = NBRC 12689]EIU2602529.1 LysR family transcriptional regulator [Pseudomonas aeruginosa]EIU2883956.1 LysR family transcriptional regulator [Pseudomonas aeruginosa]EIU7188793.1 LysR family transcriptional regulator [Pseudomonas aeruginosa]